MRLNHVEQDYLVKLVDGLPPVKNLFFITASKDQIEEYQYQKSRWQLLKKGLKCFFSGGAWKKKLRNELKIEPPELLLLDIDRWLKFYDLLSYGWEEVEHIFQHSSIHLPLKSPGEALTFILEQLSIYHCSESLLPYYSFSPSTFEKDYRVWKRIVKKNNSNTNLSTSEEKTLKKLVKKFESNPRKDFMQGEYFRQLCIDIFSKSKDRRTKSKLKSYLTIQSNFEAENQKLSRKHSSKGYAWTKGKKLIGKNGGYA